MRIVSKSLLSAVVALPLLATFSSAHAGGYVGIGIGAQSNLEGDIATHFDTDAQSDTSRLMLGQRFGALAFEASVFGTQLRGKSAFTGKSDFATVSLGVDLKYYVGLLGGLEAYGKIGLNKTWLTGPATEGMDYQGRGQEYGAGLQYTINLPLTQVGLWLDYSVQNTELREAQPKGGASLDGEIRMMNLGVSVGF